MTSRLTPRPAARSCRHLSRALRLSSRGATLNTANPVPLARGREDPPTPASLAASERLGSGSRGDRSGRRLGAQGGDFCLLAKEQSWRTTERTRPRRVGGEAPVPALRPVVSSPPPSEPDLRLPPHPALHEHIERLPARAASVVSEVPAPMSGNGAPVFTGDLLPSSVLRAHWTPSPCGRLSRPPRCGATRTTTTGPPPRPGGNSERCACPEPPTRVRRAPPGRFPRSLIDRSAGSAPSCTPGASPRATATRPAASRARSATGRTRRSRTTTGTEHPNSP
jgi:hypothetical protein